MRQSSAQAAARPVGDLLADFVEQLEAAAAGPVAVERDESEEAKERARRHLVDFAVYASGGRWQPARHLALLSEKLEAVDRGEITRLIVMMPPRHGKSELCTFYFPTWYEGRHPDRRAILTAYGAELATVFGRRTRNLMGELGPDLFGVRVAGDSSAADRWDIAHHDGGVVATGIGGALTGKGADLMVIDDPFKNWEEASSPAIRNRVWDEYQATLRTRLAPGGAIVVIHTRWNDDDLIARLQKAEADGTGEHWEILRLPALAEAGDLLGRAPGEALWPERFSKIEIERTMAVLGAIKAAALYQQKPLPAGTGIFKREWFARIVDPRAVPGNLVWVRFWDLATSTKTQADRTAGYKVAFGDDGTLWIANGLAWRKEWPDSRTLIIQTAELDGPGVPVGVEKVGFQGAAWQELMREKKLAAHTILAVPVDRDKVSRALPWSARAEGGKVALVQGDWIGEFLDEVEAFPNGAHDDKIDAVSGAVQMLGLGDLQEPEDDYDPDPNWRG